MKILHIIASLAIAGVVNHAQAIESFLCEHDSGDFNFALGPVLIERDGKDVSVFRVESGIVMREDRWLYRVYAENEALGLQAVRANPKGGANSSVAVAWGGLLFLIWDNKVPYAHIVLAHAPSKNTQSETLTCKRQ